MVRKLLSSSPNTPAESHRPSVQVEEQQGRRLSDYKYAALDVESTGLFPDSHDRIIEIAIVLFGLDGTIHGEYETLVNPRRDLGPHHIHGLTMREVAYAPMFGDIAGDVLALLEGRVVVAHNSRFDVAFLSAELRRASIPVPEIAHLCTMRLACQNGLGRRLSAACASLGVMASDAHTAIGDARAAAQLLMAWYGGDPAHSILDLRACGCSREPSAVRWPRTGSNAKPLIRSEASRVASAERAYLARLVAGLPAEDGPNSPNESAYLDVLDRALEDRLLSRTEAAELISIAESEGLSAPAVHLLHRQYFRALAVEAWADGAVSDIEAADLRLVAEFLGIDADAAREAIAQPPGRETAPGRAERIQRVVPGTSVCFTGTLQATIRGQLISREQAHELALEAGLVVLESVTKKLDVLVVADPQSSSGKAEKARRYGTRIVAEAVFWQAIGVATD